MQSPLIKKRIIPMKNHKTLTYQAVANAGLLLMQASPINQTTTLEVKTLLRSLRFNAIQAEVSQCMARLAEEINLNTKTETEESVSFTVFSIIPFPVEDDEDQDDGLFKFRK